MFEGGKHSEMVEVVFPASETNHLKGPNDQDLRNMVPCNRRDLCLCIAAPTGT